MIDHLFWFLHVEVKWEYGKTDWRTNDCYGVATEVVDEGEGELWVYCSRIKQVQIYSAYLFIGHIV